MLLGASGAPNADSVGMDAIAAGGAKDGKLRS